MINYDDLWLKKMAKMGIPIQPDKGFYFSTISPIMEWIKWLSYESAFEKKRIEYFDSKKISELSPKELKEENKYIKNKTLAKLFEIYALGKCSEKDYIRVYKYMCNESIEELMLSKLTSEELRYAKQEINRLSKIPEEELSAKVNEEKKPEKYKQLSMVDSYILHIIANIDYDRKKSKLIKKINAQKKEDNIRKTKQKYPIVKIF